MLTSLRGVFADTARTEYAPGFMRVAGDGYSQRHILYHCRHGMRCFLITWILVASCIAAPSAQENFGYGEYRFVSNGPCLTPESRAKTRARIADNIAALRAKGLLNEFQSKSPPAFGWPLTVRTGFTDPGYHGIPNYVDHNALFPDQISDHDCGTRSYDLPSGYNHQGTDYYLWPFAWNKMDNEDVEIVAVDAGTIILKDDGNFDRNCDFGDNPVNRVAVYHSGNIVWYAHMKNGSTTSKLVGQSVAAGEYLGTVGSSGNSPVPHLHLECYDSGNNLVDPYAGTCNSTTNTSWWTTQRPYYDQGINKLSTHSSMVSWGECPDQDITNLQNNFATNPTIYFYTFGRDGLFGDQYTYWIRRPDGTIWHTWNWTFDIASFYSVYWLSWFWTFGAGEPTGQWTLELQYNGGPVLDHDFYIWTATGAEPPLASTALNQNFPNPFSPKTTIAYTLQTAGNVSLRIFDVQGRLVITLVDGPRSAGPHEVAWHGHDANGSPVTSGNYFYKLESQGSVLARKMILVK